MRWAGCFFLVWGRVVMFEMTLTTTQKKKFAMVAVAAAVVVGAAVVAAGLLLKTPVKELETIGLHR